LDNPKIKEQFEVCRKIAESAVQRIDNLIARSKKPQKVQPVFKWGQSNSEVFIEIKLSHRFDAPGCLDTLSREDVHDVISLTQGTSFRFSRKCVQANQPLLFELEFPLFQPIESVDLEPNSVGKLTVVLKKSEEKLWKDLFSDPADRKKFTFKVWSELSDSYPEMEDFYELYDDYLETLED
jgi:hypothetical protein